MMKFIMIVLAAYLVGSFNTAYLMSRSKGFDIRSKGSKNPGASNIAIVMGNKAGAICAVIDILKAFFVVKIVSVLNPSERTLIGFVMSAVVLGHMFPFHMGFRGGKGLACLVGSLMGYSFKVFSVYFLIEVPLLLLVNYICFVPITVSISLVIVYFILEKSMSGAAALAVVSLCVCIKHIENIRRITKGEEVRFSMLWNRKKEEERLGKTADDL